MKLLLISMILFIAAFSNNATALNYFCNDQISQINPDEERYVIVYKMNGVTHAVIINHSVNCQDLFDTNALFQQFGITILDCGPLGDVIIPPGTTYVDENQALNHLQLSEWP